MANSPGRRPDDSSTAPGSPVRHRHAGEQRDLRYAGSRHPTPSNEPGQYPPGSSANALFGGPQPTGTGAPGTQGARPDASTDPTAEPGQMTEGISGIGPPETVDSGAPP